MTEVKINLPSGCWNYYFRDKNTLKALTPISQILTSKEDTELTCAIPKAIANNKDAQFYFTRIG